MIHIWLCDDEPLYLSSLHDMLTGIFQKREIGHCIHQFDSAGALYDAMRTQIPDLIFLDLILGNDDGYHVAEMLRHKAFDTEIVFITNYPEKMSQAFSFKPIGFIQKPIDHNTLSAVIDRFLFFYHQKCGFYTITTKRLDLRILFSDILYFESVSHQIHLHIASSDDPIVFSEKLDTIANHVNVLQFQRCHKSFLVNVSAISAINRHEMTLTLSSGHSLPISRRYYAALLDRFMQFKMR